MAARGPAAARRSRTELQTLRGTVLMVRNIRLRPVSGLRLFCVIRNVFFFYFKKRPGSPLVLIFADIKSPLL